MVRKSTPYIFLMILAVILTFILGVRYGKNVEQTNKTISYLLTLTPIQKQPSPTITESMRFISYTNKQCGVQFLYPSYLDKKESSDSATFTKTELTFVKIDCGKNTGIKEELKWTTQEIQFKNKKIIAEVQKTAENELLSFTIYNTIKGKNISVTVEKNLYPLFESTLQFLQ